MPRVNKSSQCDMKTDYSGGEESFVDFELVEFKWVFELSDSVLCQLQFRILLN